MPQGKGTYGSQVGRPSKKRTSFVNDNGWDNKLNDVNKREFINGGNMPDNKTKGNDYASIINQFKTRDKQGTPRQYSNPIDTGQSRAKSNPLDTGQSREKSYASNMGNLNQEWNTFLSTPEKGYRTKEEMSVKRKDLISRKSN